MLTIREKRGAEPLTDKDKRTAEEFIRKYLDSIYITKEYRMVLSRKRFGFSSELVDTLISAIEKFGILVDPHPLGTVLPDMNDLPFYEVVMEKRDDNAYLVTGNIKHFPKEPFIVTPRELLDILGK